MVKNKVVYNNKTKLYTIDQFLIASKGQKIEFQGTMQDTISKDFKFNFHDVKLSNVKAVAITVDVSISFPLLFFNVYI